MKTPSSSTCRITLAGNPNVGKSTVFNGLTGLKQHTGNWSGKTVDLAIGEYRYSGTRFLLQDLPGTYSVISDSPEEEVALSSICFTQTDYTLVVVDATCLARNLNLVLQILEITPRVVLCVNLIDEAERKSIFLDLDALSRQLAIPVIGISAHRRKDLQHLKQFLYDQAQHSFSSSPSPVLPRYGDLIESAISAVADSISGLPFSTFSQRFMAIRLLENNKIAEKLLDSFSLVPQQRNRILSVVATQQSFLNQQGISPTKLCQSISSTIAETSAHLSVLCARKSIHTQAAFSSALKIDRLLTSKKTGIPIMLCFFLFLLWLTISGANRPSQLLFSFFQWLKPYLSQGLTALSFPPFLIGLLVDGIYGTVTWVTAVMLPPMLIFFPLFTLLEDLGYLPRLAFNLDHCFQRVGSCGKQALTMCMGFGCNAVGVTGTRIISHKRLRHAAMITNCFIPCNGRFSLLITLSSLFIGRAFFPAAEGLISALFVFGLILTGIGVTLLFTKLLTHFSKDKDITPFTLELPPFRRPQVMKILLHSLWDRTFRILSRALRTSAPAGAIIWLLANLSFGNQSLLLSCASFLDPFAHLLGLDGMILLAFLLALPANEIVLPILLMGYLSSGQMTEATNPSQLYLLLQENGWTLLTAINVMLFSLLHFPCATTLWTIQKESNSFIWTAMGFFIPTLTAILVCMTTNALFHLISFF